MTKRVLVAGGAGFIGSHIAEAYLADGWEVEIIDDLSRGKEANIPQGACFVRADVRSPEARTRVATEGWRISAALRGWRKPRKRRAWVTTLTLLMAMAAAARTGLRRTPKKGKRAPMATGMRRPVGNHRIATSVRYRRRTARAVRAWVISARPAEGRRTCRR